MTARVLSLGIVMVGLLFGLSVPAFADPGAPGLDRPATAVYEDNVRDELPTLSGGGGGGVEPGEGLGVGGVGDLGEEGASPASLPFTGFAAALVLALGIAALLIGLSARTAASWPLRA